MTGEMTATTGHLGDAWRRVRKMWDLRRDWRSGDREWDWRSGDRGRTHVDVVGRDGSSGCRELLWVEEVVVGASVDVGDMAVDVVDDGLEGEGEAVLLMDQVQLGGAEGVHCGADSP